MSDRVLKGRAMNSTKFQAPSLQEIEEAETWIQNAHLLDQLEIFLRSHGSDEELIDGLDYLRADNDMWKGREEVLEIARLRLGW